MAATVSHASRGTTSCSETPQQWRSAKFGVSAHHQATVKALCRELVQRFVTVMGTLYAAVGHLTSANVSAEDKRRVKGAIRQCRKENKSAINSILDRTQRFFWTIDPPAEETVPTLVDACDGNDTRTLAGGHRTVRALVHEVLAELQRTHLHECKNLDVHGLAGRMRALGEVLRGRERPRLPERELHKALHEFQGRAAMPECPRNWCAFTAFQGVTTVASRLGRARVQLAAGHRRLARQARAPLLRVLASSTRARPRARDSGVCALWWPRQGQWATGFGALAVGAGPGNKVNGGALRPVARMG